MTAFSGSATMAPAVRLTTLGRRDRASVKRLVSEVGVFSESEIAIALELFDASLAGDDDYEMFGARDERDAVIGFCIIGPTPDSDRTWDLYWIVSSPASRGAGVGTAMLAEVERRVESRGARLLIAETSSRSDYAAARAFYMKRGFVEAARVREYYAPEDDRIILTKRFHARPGRDRELVGT